MKKVTSIVAMALMACSLTACGNRNTAFRTPGVNPNRTNLSIDQRNNIGVVPIAYRDGVYLGEGNKTSSGNQVAVVTIRGGRITDVVLKTIDTKGREMNIGNTTGGNTNTTTHGSIYGSNGGTTNGITGATNGTTANGVIVNRNTGGTTGGTTNGTASGITPGGNATINNPNLPGSPMGGTTIGTNLENTGAIIGNRRVGINTGTALTSYDRVRRDLANAIVANQTHNVTINNVGNQAAAVDNWKLAVSRALNSARR